MKPPAARNKFRGIWDEIVYLEFRAGYWMYEREQRARAKPFIERLRAILKRLRVRDDSLSSVTVKGLVADFDRDQELEIHYKKAEIRMLRKLLSYPPPVPGYDWSTVLSEMDLLATLLEENNRRAEALRTIDECKELARKHRLPYHAGEARKVIWRAVR